MQPPSVMAPPPAAAPVTVTLPQRSLPPPPPMAAPTMMLSPVGSSRMPPLSMAMPSPKGAAMPAQVAPMAQPYDGAAPSSENDMKVLLELAVASGNQTAVDA